MTSARWGSMVAGCWSLVAGCWLLVAGCWLLVAGCWLLGASTTDSSGRMFLDHEPVLPVDAPRRDISQPHRRVADVSVVESRRLRARLASRAPRPARYWRR